MKQSIIIVTLILIVYCSATKADDTLAKACDITLQVCLSVVDAQEKQITDLQVGYKAMAESKVDAAKDSVLQSLPWWVYTIVGGVVGYEIGKRL